MGTGVSALLISPDESVLRSLQQALDALEIQCYIARNYEQARVVLEGVNPPEIVFSDFSLPDETFAEVIRTATQAERRVPVIAVSQIIDYRFYTKVLEAGAADFLMPPFLPVNVFWMLDKVRKKEIFKIREARSRL